MNPSDPCVTSIDNADEGVFQGWKRAAAQRYFAEENDLDFRDVRCLRLYAMIYTRQEAWEAEGRQEWADKKNMEARVGWYFDRVAVAEPVSSAYFSLNPSTAAQTTATVKTIALPAGWYLDIDGTTPAKGYTANDAPAIVPDDWMPENLSYVWHEVDRHHPRAEPVLVCEAW